jgi:large conductance mechanosensitive channel
MLKAFREFAIKGNMVDLAIGIIIGAAFGGVVKSLVDDIIMPPIGLLLGNVDFVNLFWILKPGSAEVTTLAQAKAAGAVTLNYGQFGITLVNFGIVAFAVFLLVQAINRAKGPQAVVIAAPATKDCPFCCSAILIKASKCAHCTADVPIPN